MFDSLFASKNKKLVLKLQKEHKKLVSLATDIIKAFEENNLKRLRSKMVFLVFKI